MTESMAGMEQVLNSMEQAIRLRSQARAESRAQEAAEERRKFQEKLMRAAASAASEAELDGMAIKVKGKEDAVRRDQLMGLMMAGF